MSATCPPPPVSALPPSPTEYRYPGAKWWTMDFHSHTPASSDGYLLDKSITPRQWLLNHMVWGLDAVVVSDHNSGEWIDRLKEANVALSAENPAPAGYRPLTIFPGVEISTANAWHLLAILDPSKGGSDIAVLLGACRYRGQAGESSVVASSSFDDCVKAIRDAGGLALAAHADKAKGLLHEISGLTPTVRQALTGLHGLEVVDPAAIHAETRKEEVFHRLPQVLGSDSHSADGIGYWGFTRIHMTYPNLEGLRIALEDGCDDARKSWSVRRVPKDCAEDWNRWPTCAIEKVAFEGLKVNPWDAGRQLPVEIPLHPRFNVFVGSRGSGKSTVERALRLAMGRSDELRDALKEDFWKWAKVPVNKKDPGVLKKTPQASSIRVFCRAPAGSAELQWEAGMAGNQSSAIPKVFRNGQEDGVFDKTRFPAVFYSQKQILELASESRGVLDEIDRACGMEVLKAAHQSAIQAYRRTRTEISTFQARLASEAKDRAALNDVLAELKKVQSEAVRTHQLRQRQWRVLFPDQTPNATNMQAIVAIGQWADQIGLPDLPDDAFPGTLDVETEAAARRYFEAQEKLKAIADVVREQAKKVNDELNALSLALQDSDWKKRVDEAKAAFDALVGTGTGHAMDPRRLAQLNQDRARLEVALQGCDSVRKEISRMEEKAKTELDAVHAARQAMTEVRKKFITDHAADADLLKMTLIPMGASLDTVEAGLRAALEVDETVFAEVLGANSEREGAYVKRIDLAENKCDAVTAVRRDILVLAGAVDAPVGFRDLQNNIRKKLQAGIERRVAIETWAPDDGLQLEYRMESDGGRWKRIEQGSIGQKTAAILSFLLSFGEAPLILDQPEDDLDTRMIMNLIVSQIRRIKKTRQLLIITHNPNIVVHGDAELIHAMEDRNGCVSRSAASGGLQEPDTRAFICDVMEGGEKAFKTRYARMGKKSPDHI